MPELADLGIGRSLARTLPDWADTVSHLRSRLVCAPARLLSRVTDTDRPLVQPRCGVGDHAGMLRLLTELEAQGRPDILSVTIDSHTRLKRFRTAAQTLARDPGDLNGYPLVAHGWQRGRELAAAVSVPLEVRHGSPDARDLFAVSLASGFLSFEGGGIGYNLPYCKDVPLADSLAAWRQVDAVCGDLARAGVVVDRELFGTLTAVLVPPSISIATTMIEAVLAAGDGVRCLSIAYPQGGEPHQDVAALRAIRSLGARYLPDDVAVHPVLHGFMGVFPRSRAAAEALICLGGVVGRLGKASKIINKTRQEAYGIPDAGANAEGIRLTAAASSDLLAPITLDEARIADEQQWIEREVEELLTPILARTDVAAATTEAFARGRLDVPFSASVHARSEVLPCRDRDGAIRYRDAGALPFSAATLRRNRTLAGAAPAAAPAGLVQRVTADINYFLRRDHTRQPLEVPT